MYRFRADDRYVDPRYLEAYLLSAQAWLDIDEMKTGGSESGLNLTQARFRELQIPIAPRDEQARIVAAIEKHFSHLNAGDQSIRNCRGRLQQLRSALVLETLQGNWPQVLLGEVTEDQRYGSSARASKDSTGVPILRMGNIQDGCIDYSDLKYLARDHPDVTSCTLRTGDLLFNRTNSPELVGKSAIFDGLDGPTVFASYLIRVRLARDILPSWANLAINSPMGRRYIATVRTQQVGQANVNGTKLKEFPIPLPPLDDQLRLMEKLEGALDIIDRLIQDCDLAQTRSQRLRSSVLAFAFSGQLVPPASPTNRSQLSRKLSKPEGCASRRPTVIQVGDNL
jgi:type I restriction enzyme S subunit